MCVRMPLKDTCTHSCMRAYTHMQDGMTALMLACATKNEAAALLLMEATQKAGALDVQVNVCWEGGWAGGGGRGGEGGRGRSQSLKRVGRGTDTCVYVLPQGGDKKCSALIFCAELGLESAVAKLLSLGADAALKDEVRACSYMNTCMYSVYVCTFVDAWRMRISLSIMHIIQTCYVCMYM